MRVRPACRFVCALPASGMGPGRDESSSSWVGTAGILVRMVIAVTEPAAVPATRSRWSLAYAWTAGLIAYCVAIMLASEAAATWINDFAWTLASAVALLYCFYAAVHIEPERRSAWR